MHNPFESLNVRLDKLEALARETQQMLRGAIEPKDETGGMELAQEITRLSKARIYALVCEGRLPVSKRGNRLFFSRADLLDWISQGKRGYQASDS
ncbi:helix-turn-helix domain-containing protein [Hymenobacter volaticus]|uniref:Helix-turn-helix domain-containing protein n=1 Tax=Hymenobacter volaticus TaxID=2932254 RepID=A0ABY4G4M4_9BACT|nr:helix-turn-helix domain-containing protein [Hymenobacter volaticus]UOQ65722.1 helix-turn-helix domain-containing protein [Hymenobacter volaticus]